LFARAGKLQCSVDVIRLMVASIILSAFAWFSGWASKEIVVSAPLSIIVSMTAK
jgi:hypothetical protein